MKNNDGKGWHTRFYKGLSNHSPEEVKGYFKVHHKQVKPLDEEDCRKNRLTNISKYYAEPQQLKNGVIKGHSHITIQKLDGNNLPDAKDFTFFKGLYQPDKNGILSVRVKGLSPGDYRICTLVSSFFHQPVIMPVAKHGSQDDLNDGDGYNVKLMQKEAAHIKNDK
nr:14792_t:CDS:2 [Entrophospora candida]